MSERPEFVAPPAGAGEASGEGWSLRDESVTPKLLIYEDFESDGLIREQLGVGFGAAITGDDGSLVCGVGPGEWLLLGERSGLVPGATRTVAVDLTHGLALFRLSGPAAPDVLASVCSVDTSEAMLPDGAVCGASVARVACTLVRNDAAGDYSYLILLPRSSGRFLFDALRDAGAPQRRPRELSGPAPPGTTTPN